MNLHYIYRDKTKIQHLKNEVAQHKMHLSLLSNKYFYQKITILFIIKKRGENIKHSQV